MFIFTLCYIFFNIPAAFLFNKFGILVPTMIASTCFVLGAWIRLLVSQVENGFYFVMVGQTIAGIGWTFMVQAPTKLAAIWFGDHERSIATTIGSLAGPIGCIIGFIMPMFFITLKPPPTPDQT